ncbi:hypothetical protein KFK09_001927 [Dendrobium nobile]|uniref:Uncharacterized protein n=1 Tax=Dendrobium nobile TaxID=94219 RepID=A0A8T3C8V3_DENNO|nr:hypothetical protein KFK09_001927 [Dendrobium nobile]
MRRLPASARAKEMRTSAKVAVHTSKGERLEASALRIERATERAGYHHIPQPSQLQQPPLPPLQQNSIIFIKIKINGIS